MKKGFTLVELLAVLVILGILSVLIVPKIVNTLNESEQKTNMVSAENLLKAAEYKYQNNGIEGISENLIIDFTAGQNIDKLNYSGSKPEKGLIIVAADGNISMAVKIGKNCYIKGFSSKDITNQEYNEETCKAPTSFAKDSWAEIKANLIANRNAYTIGSRKQVVIDNTSYTVRLANTSSCPENWPSAASQTTCGVVIEFINTIKDSTNSNNGNNDGHVMNSTNTNVGGWPSSSMRSYLNTTLFNKLPDELKADGIILDTSVVSGHGSTEETNFTSTDKLYLLSYVEVWGSNYDNDSVKLVSDTVTDGTRQLEYYTNPALTKIKNSIGGNANNWWLRSAYLPLSHGFLIVAASGDNSLYTREEANVVRGVAPAFRILD